MNRKTLLTLVAIAAVLLAIIIAGVSVLYSGTSLFGRRSSQKARQTVSLSSRKDVLMAVPSDAAAIFCFEDLSDGAALFTNSTKVFGALLNENPDGPFHRFFSGVGPLMKDNSRLKSAQLAVSLHFSGSIVPLAALQVTGCDSATVANVLSLASSVALRSRTYSGDESDYVFLSPSEALMLSSQRHLEEGVSILSNASFLKCAGEISGDKLLFFSNAYASRLMPAFLHRSVSRYSDFVKGFSDWVAFSVDDCRDERLVMGGKASNGSGPGYFANVVQAMPSSECSFAKVAPSGTVYAVDLCLSDKNAYLESFRAYLDAAVMLTASEKTRDNLRKSTGTGPDDWVAALDIKEVVRLRWRASDNRYDAVMVRTGKKNQLVAENHEAAPYQFGGFASALFGSLFSVSDESSYATTGEWIISGSRAAVEDFVSRREQGDALSSLLSDASMNALIPSRGSVVAYFSPAEASIDNTFAAPMRQAVDATFDGAQFEPCVLTLGASGLGIEVRRAAAVVSVKTPAVIADAEVLVPEGPFTVKNSGTGADNLLKQQSNMYLSLTQTDGKGIWSIPFDAPLCGRVETIDYYNNGKLQFLFCAGKNLYLLDRLGRFVGGFPASLGKEVLLGPAAYDFTGAKGYSVMVLHKDNSIGFYNIHGVVKEGWKGISCQDTIIGLPELLKASGKSWWVVRTAREALVYPFEGGEPAYSGEGNKSIRRDSTFEVADNGSVKVVCNDGKTRNIKL